MSLTHWWVRLSPRDVLVRDLAAGLAGEMTLLMANRMRVVPC
jgi:hypothetical protein